MTSFYDPPYKPPNRVLMGIYHGGKRHRMIHRRTMMARLARRIGVDVAVLRNTYETFYAHCYFESEFCKFVALGEVSPDGKEFDE